MEIEKRIEELRKSINWHNYLYYVKNNPQISDEDFDYMLKELEDLEKENPQFFSPVSPTQRVGGSPAKGFEKYTHEIAMLSLANTYNIDELKEFDKRVKQEINEPFLKYFAELKIDGLSLSLVYKEGKLISAATRGNGHIGELVTENVKRIKSIPLELFEPVSIIIRGEVYFPLSSFHKMNEKRIESSETPFSNPRNAASGTLRQQDPSIVAERKLAFFAHSFGKADSEFKINSQHEMFNKIEKLGFPVNPHGKLCNNVDELFDYCTKWEKDRKTLDYDIDGIVIKVDNFEYQKILGNTSKNPRWAIFFKFKAEKAISKVNNIIFQVGRTGIITPVAELEPIEIGGVTVKRSTLHNFEEIKRLGIMIGDYVEVERAADVIPRVNRVLSEKRDGTQKSILIPENCPKCNSRLFHKGAYLKCENVNCPARVEASIQNFVSRIAMNIEGMGAAIVETFLKNGLIKNIADIYSLNIEKIESLPKMGKKSAENLINSIEKSKNNGLEKLIMGLGIPGIGENNAKFLAIKFGNIDSLMNSSLDKLLEVDGIGEQSALNILEFFDNEENRNIIKKLKEKGVNVRYIEKSGNISGKSFVVTGSFADYSRNDIHRIISENGGIVKNSISNKVDYVIAGENAGSKLEKANKQGIKIIDLDDFLNMIATYNG